MNKLFSMHNSQFQNDLYYHLVDQEKRGLISRRDLLRSAAAAGVLLPLGAAFSGKAFAQEKPKQGGTLRIGITRPVGRPDPLTSRSKSEGYLLKPVLPPLGRLGQDGVLYRGLATSWSSNDTATEWTFGFVDCKWSDGKPFGAADVKHTLDTVLNPDAPIPAGSGFRGILSHGDYEIIDPKTMKFHLNRPYVDFPYVLTYAAMTWYPEGYKEGDFIAGKVGGIGPYLLDSYTDSGASYRKNPDYFDAEHTYVDKLEFVFFDDDQSMSLALQGGQVDTLPIVAGTSVLALRASPDIDILSARSSAYVSIRMHVDEKPFQDKRVRQALAYTLDRQAVLDTLAGGDADLGNDHVFAPVFAQSAPVIEAVPQRTQDIAKARALLSEAGYADGLELKLVSEQYSNVPQYLQLLQSHAAEAGFKISLELMPQNAYYGNGSNQPWMETPFGATDWGERATPGAMISPAYLTGAPFNESRYRNAAFDDAAKKFDSESDPVARKSYAIKAATILNDEVPAIIGYFARTQRAASKRVRNFAAGPSSLIDLTGTWLD